MQDIHAITLTAVETAVMIKIVVYQRIAYCFQKEHDFYLYSFWHMKVLAILLLSFLQDLHKPVSMESKMEAKRKLIAEGSVCLAVRDY